MASVSVLNGQIREAAPEVAPCRGSGQSRAAEERAKSGHAYMSTMGRWSERRKKVKGKVERNSGAKRGVLSRENQPPSSCSSIVLVVLRLRKEHSKPKLGKD